MIGNILKGIGKVAGLGAGAAFYGAKTNVGKSIFKAGLAYAGVKAAGAAADYIDNNQIPGTGGIGGFYSGALRVAGAVVGGSAMITHGTRALGGIGGAAHKGLLKTDLVKNHAEKLSGSMLALQKYSGKMQSFSAGRLLREKGGWGTINEKTGKRGFGATRMGLKGAGHVGLGLLKSPVAPIADTIGLGMRGVGKIPGMGAVGAAGKKIHKYVGKTSPGARMFGWGGALGAAKLGAEIGNFQGEDYSYDDVMQSLGGRDLALGGQQMYVPTSGQGPRRMNPNATAGLTQSLHRLR